MVEAYKKFTLKRYTVIFVEDKLQHHRIKSLVEWHGYSRLCVNGSMSKDKHHPGNS